MSMASMAATASRDLGVSLAAVVFVGIGAQWLASRVRIPSILILLVAGVMAGPDVTGLIDPGEMLGDLLFPAVSLAVGILLFEGGLGLRFRELERQGAVPVLRLVTIGAAVTWAIGGLASAAFIGLDARTATLLGAILIVSGPTVMIPLLRHARAREPVNGVLQWEGIVIDPIGATLAVVVLRVVIAGDGFGAAAAGVLTTSGAGVATGLLGAALLTLAFNRHWVPDELHNAVTLAMVAAVFAGADLVRAEAGLFATTVMGVVLANQRFAPVEHIREFEENLGTLILSGLFVVLGANVDLDSLVEWAPEALGLLAVLVLVARPAAVWASTVGSSLTSRERGYLACMAPRGIIAAAVSAVFALELAEEGRPVDALVPVTFIVIVGTVVIYSLAARPMASRLHVARPEPRGVVLIGGPRWAIDLGVALSELDVPVLVVTRDRREAESAAEHGLFTYTQRLDSDELGVAIDSVGARLAIATSRAQELNAYGVRRAIAALGRANVYYLPRHDRHGEGEADAVTRRPFGRRFTQAAIAEALATGGRIVTVTNHGDDGDGSDGSEGDRAGADGAGGNGAGSNGTGGNGTDEPPPREPEGAITLVTVSADGIPTIASDELASQLPTDASGIYLVAPEQPG